MYVYKYITSDSSQRWRPVICVPPPPPPPLQSPNPRTNYAIYCEDKF